MKIYWLENIEFGTMVAVRCVKEGKLFPCINKKNYFRMLITFKTYAGLLLYDPFENTTGPWRIHGDQHQHLEDVDLSFRAKRIDLEFMFG